MIIEKLELGDINQVLDLYKELSPFENSLERSIQIYKEMLLDEQYLLLVAKEDDEIIGSILGICCKSFAAGGDPFLVIEDVIVKEGLRGKGIGKKLMITLEEFAKKKHCVYGILVSSDYRKEAHRYYENMGFIDGVKGFRKLYKCI